MSLLNKFFAKNLLGLAGTPEKEEFISSIFQSAREGHLCYKASSAPSLPAIAIEEGKTLSPNTPLVRDSDRYYLQKNWVYETYLLEQVERLRSIQVPSDEPLFSKQLALEDKLSSEQKEIAKHLFLHPFSVLCGGPGTGKTHTAACFVRLLLSCSSNNFKILLSAPTGKAALHLQSSLFAKTGIQCEAKTLHRLLRLKPGETRLFSKKRIDADLIIVDESSMMDVAILAHLLESVGDQTRLILMGDPQQLPPVEIGGVFSDLAELYGVFLRKCMRTEDPLLQQAASAIIQGDEESFFSSVSVQDRFDDTLVDYLYEKIQPTMSPDKIDPANLNTKLACLDALRQGPFGLEELNRKILEKMERNCPEGWWWAVPIMVNANLATLNLYNGSTGVLIGQKNKRMNLSLGTAYFPETGALINPPPFELSFVLSIHKSQGSEFDEVIALFPEGSDSFGKEALYTAATRAKKRWEVIGKKEILQKILSKNCVRMSGFKERLRFIQI